jgi:hypothetical protein
MKFAEYHQVAGFVVEKVAPLTSVPNPRSKSWKILVPARLKEVLEKTEMFPKGWIARPFTFYSGPRRQEREEQRPGGGTAAVPLVEEQPKQGQQGVVEAAAVVELAA